MRNERGVALVLAVLVLTVIGALVAAAFFAGTQEQRMAEQTRWSQRALGAADGGLAAVLRQWPEAASSLSLYPADSLAVAGELVGFVRRLGRDVYLVDITGRAARARQRVGLLVRRSIACESPAADGVEMTQSNCHIANAFPESSAVAPLRSRAWIQLF